MKYHVNMQTGLPGVCRATKGRCPFAPADEHFDTFTEAQESADLLNERRYNLVKSKNQRIDPDEILEGLRNQRLELYHSLESINKDYKSLAKLSDDDLVDYISNTNDSEFLRQVSQRRIILGLGTRDNRALEAAISNPNVPSQVIETLCQFSPSVGDGALLAVSRNPNVTGEQLIRVAKGLSKLQLKRDVLRNPKISREQIVQLIGENGDKIKNEDHDLCGLYANPNCPRSAVRAMLQIDSTLTD